MKNMGNGVFRVEAGDVEACPLVKTRYLGRGWFTTALDQLRGNRPVYFDRYSLELKTLSGEVINSEVEISPGFFGIRRRLPNARWTVEICLGGIVLHHPTVGVRWTCPSRGEA